MAAMYKFTFNPQQRADMHRLRWRVAGIVKDLAAGRALHDPAWCQATLLDQIWFRTSTRPTNWSDLYFVICASANLHRFHEDYGPCLSSMQAITSNERCYHVARTVRRLVSRLTTCSKLRRIESDIRRNKPVQWDKQIRWELLPELRRVLDALPESE